MTTRLSARKARTSKSEEGDDSPNKSDCTPPTLVSVLLTVSRIEVVSTRPPTGVHLPPDDAAGDPCATSEELPSDIRGAGEEVSRGLTAELVNTHSLRMYKDTDHAPAHHPQA